MDEHTRGRPGLSRAVVAGPGPATDTVVGWRYWQIPRGAERLRSVSYRNVEWPPGSAVRAGCVGGGHAAPAPGCACGLYATTDLDGLRAHSLCLRPGALVLGTVRLGGRLLEDGDAWRGEYAYPVSLALVTESVDEADLQRTLERLGAYGVEVTTTTAAEAVGEVSAAILANLTMSA